MSKLISESAFGEQISSDMKIGDLVSWSEWMVIEGELIENIFYGTIISKVTSIEGNRPISLLNIACSISTEIITLSPFQIRIKETN